MKRISSTHKRLNRTVGKALHRYDMIAPGDRILVGISGGKDSLTLFRILQNRRQWAPVTYDLVPVYIDPGFDPQTGTALVSLLAQWGAELRWERTDDGIVAHGPDNRENPCFLCSRLRRRRLFEIADELDCRKLALGHHKDDLIESLFLNVLYAGEISTFRPDQSFFEGRFRLIRPLAFTDEQIIRRFARESGFPVLENSCPSAHTSKRHEIKQMLGGLYRTNRKIRGNIFRAMHNVKTDYLLCEP